MVKSMKCDGFTPGGSTSEKAESSDYHTRTCALVYLHGDETEPHSKNHIPRDRYIGLGTPERCPRCRSLEVTSEYSIAMMTLMKEYMICSLL